MPVQFIYPVETEREASNGRRAAALHADLLSVRPAIQPVARQRGRDQRETRGAADLRVARLPL